MEHWRETVYITFPLTFLKQLYYEKIWTELFQYKDFMKKGLGQID